MSGDQTAQAILGLFVLFLLGVGLLVAYIGFCAVLWRIGRKFQDEGFLAYCIPVYQWVLMCRCAGVSGWHAAAMCVPMVNYGAMIWIFGNIAARMGKSFWGFGLGSLVLVPTLILAFGNGKPVVETAERLEDQVAPVGMRRYLLTCVQGEMAGARIEIPAGSIVIGRSPQQAQIVLSHPHVSSSHVRVWTEPMTGSTRIWMEDLHSRNGTSFRRGTEQEWTALKGSGIPLGEGDMIRIADGVAEFRVIGTEGGWR
jgi:hypothetical protein